jgi:hypothetical protein
VSVDAAAVAFLAASAAHLGFQATVTAVVYPALARVPAAQWRAAHRAHTRGITPVVAVVYGALALTGGRLLLSRPGAAGLVALAAAGIAVLVTAVAAAPAHGRLAGGPAAPLLRRLLRADRVRLVAAMVSTAAAVLRLV